jgi:hypothetical protein
MLVQQLHFQGFRLSLLAIPPRGDADVGFWTDLEGYYNWTTLFGLDPSATQQDPR